MKSHELLEVIGEAQDSYVLDAKIPKKKSTPVWVKWAAMAACLILVIGLVIPQLFLLNPNNEDIGGPGVSNPSLDSNLASKYPQINWPEIGAPSKNVDKISMSADMPLSEAANEITIYKAKQPNIDEICMNLSSILSITENWTSKDVRRYIANEKYTVEVNTQTGYWSFQDRSITNELYQSSEQSSLTNDEVCQKAKEVAIKFGVDQTLFSKLSVGGIEQTTFDPQTDSEVTKVVGHNVYFYPVIDGKDLWGIARFVVTLDGKGQVAGIMKSYPDLEIHSQVKAISSKDASEKILSQEGIMISDDPSDADAIVVNDYEVVYYIDIISFEEDNFFQPVYVFRGYYTNQGNVIPGYEYVALTPALDDAYFDSNS